jgi:hypothetical protein
VSALRWTRTDQSDGALEILTIVRIEGQTDLCVEVCAGPDIGDDFVGLPPSAGERSAPASTQGARGDHHAPEANAVTPEQRGPRVRRVAPCALKETSPCQWS